MGGRWSDIVGGIAMFCLMAVLVIVISWAAYSVYTSDGGSMLLVAIFALMDISCMSMMGMVLYCLVDDVKEGLRFHDDYY